MSALARMLRPLATRLANMVARAVVQLADDSKKLQLLQVGVLSDETREDVERFQNYGFTSVPREGAEALVLFVGGRRDHGVAVAVDDRRYRLVNLESGEVAMYDDLGAKIVFKRNGDVEITPSSGNVVVNGDVRADGISLKTHTHGPGTYAVAAAPGPVTVGTHSGVPL